MEGCVTSLLGEPENSGPVRVAVRATCWAVFSSMCEHRSYRTTGAGADDDLWIGTCIHSGLAWVAQVELLDSVLCFVEVFCRVPDFIVFW